MRGALRHEGQYDFIGTKLTCVPYPSGFAAFLDPDVNKALKKVLNEWGKYLQVRSKGKVGGRNRSWSDERDEN